MNDTRQLVYAISKFLKSQVREGKLPKEDVEGVEIGIQCLEAAYKLDASEPDLDVPFGLVEIFQEFLAENGVEKEVSSGDKAAAQELKNRGNNHLTSLDFSEAIACYTKAINLDPRNPTFYCNRAAAYNNIEEYESAIEDCKTALSYNPSYSKAYSRLGLAYSNLNNQKEAVNCYRKAVELDPENEILKTNLKFAEESLSSSRPTRDFSMNFGGPNELLSDLSRGLMRGLESMQNAENPTQNVFSDILHPRLDELSDVLQNLLRGSENRNTNN